MRPNTIVKKLNLKSKLSPINGIIRDKKNIPRRPIYKTGNNTQGLSLSLLDFKVTISEGGRSSFEFRTPPISHTQEIKDQLHSQ